MPKKCPLCNKQHYGYGNNGRPVVESNDVCDDCNYRKIIPARIGIKTNDDLNRFLKTHEVAQELQAELLHKYNKTNRPYSGKAKEKK